MGDSELKPHVQRGREQTASTTFNVNCFPSRTVVDGLTINFLGKIIVSAVRILGRTHYVFWC